MQKLKPVANSKVLYHRHRDKDLCALEQGTLAGLRHRTVIDAEAGSEKLALWQEEHLPGFCVPLHRHDCEEIITVLEGQIEAHIDANSFLVGSKESIRIPTWALHGFEVLGDEPVCLLALFSSASPMIFKADGKASCPPWQGGSSEHLEIEEN